MKRKSRRAQKGYFNDKQNEKKIPALREKKNNNKYSRDKRKIRYKLI